MAPTIATLRCSKDEPEIELRSSVQLDEQLDKLAAQCNADFPHVVRVTVHGYEVEIGLGLAESFVRIEHESGMPPYFTTIGNAQAEGEVAFYLFGDHPSGILRRNLIPMAQARQIIKEFFETGSRSTAVAWEKLK
jgi:hypothetical protein